MNDAPRASAAPCRQGAERRCTAVPSREIAAVAAVFLIAAAWISIRTPVGSELRYLLSGREMAEGGDWVVPHLAGVPYMEKPILFYWLSAAAQVVFGSSAFAARLPSMFAAVIIGVVTYALARELHGRRFARRAAALLLFSVGVLPIATSITTDPVFAASLTVAWYAAWRVARGAGLGWVATFWVALAASLLSKGPLGPVLVVVSWVLFAITQRSIDSLLRLRPIAGSILFLAVCAPWHVAVWLRDPRLLDFFYVRQNLRAAVDSEINHAGPPWYYVPVLLVIFFPFSIVVLTSLLRSCAGLARSLLRGATDRHGLRTYILCIALGPLVMLSAAASKLGTYLLPMVPFMAVLVALEMDRVARRRGLLRVSAMLPALAVIAAVVVGVPRLIDRYDLDRFAPAFVPVAAVAVVALVGGMSAGAWLAWRGRRAAFAAMGAGVLATLALIVVIAVDPAAAHNASALAQHVATVLGPRDVVIASSGRAQDYSVNLAIPRRIAIVGRGRELGMGHFVSVTAPDRPIPPDPYGIVADRVPGDPWMLTAGELRRLWDGPERVFYFADEDDIDTLANRAQTPIYTFDDNGKHRVYSNRPRID